MISPRRSFAGNCLESVYVHIAWNFCVSNIWCIVCCHFGAVVPLQSTYVIALNYVIFKISSAKLLVVWPIFHSYMVVSLTSHDSPYFGLILW